MTPDELSLEAYVLTGAAILSKRWQDHAIARYAHIQAFDALENAGASLERLTAHEVMADRHHDVARLAYAWEDLLYR